MGNADWIKRHEAALTLNYGKLPAVLVRGEGTRLWDADGKEYLDFFAGYGGTILGHAHPALVDAVSRQAHALWAVGNQFYTEPQVRLAEALKRTAFDGRAFFCHSGAEANEAAIKLARLSAGGEGGAEGRFKIITAQRGFHGRTLGALSATPTADYQRGFHPLVPGFVHVPYNDLEALEAAIDGQTCAIMLEPIQGEGGIHVPDNSYLSGARALCDKHNLSLIFDEVWTGCGRTGRFFGHQHAGGGVAPDIMTLGKALGGGIPVACMFAVPAKAAFLRPGTHGCTLGGNPICAAAAAVVMETLEKEKLPERAAKLGEMVVSRIRAMKNPKIKDIRGRGLMLGIELAVENASALVPAALARGLIINVTQKNVVRLAPALTISEQTLHAGLDLLEATLSGV